MGKTLELCALSLGQCRDGQPSSKIGIGRRRTLEISVLMLGQGWVTFHEEGHQAGEEL